MAVDLLLILKLPWRMTARAAGWFVDLARAPARVRELEKKVSAADDPSPVCPACGRGRVRLVGYRRETRTSVPFSSGQCDQPECGAEFRMFNDGARIARRRTEGD